MKLGYYNPQLRVKQIKNGGRVVGDLILTHHAYGYTVQLHYFDTPGYTVNESFTEQYQAENRFDKAYEEALK